MHDGLIVNSPSLSISRISNLLLHVLCSLLGVNKNLKSFPFSYIHFLLTPQLRPLILVTFSITELSLYIFKIYYFPLGFAWSSPWVPSTMPTDSMPPLPNYSFEWHEVRLHISYREGVVLHTLHGTNDYGSKHVPHWDLFPHTLLQTFALWLQLSEYPFLCLAI